MLRITSALFSVTVFLSLAGDAFAARRHSATQAESPTTPEIRTSASNTVPQCVTPRRLEDFLAHENAGLDPKYSSIAEDYKRDGEKLGVRWDFAFYQMLLETNYLRFGHDVKPKQNNFAGLGATGGGVPGESFPDVSTGVLAQMQHLVAYSGEHVADPVAKRTRDNQDEIIAISKRLGRPVRFGDLTNRWAADSSYARSILTVSQRFNEGYCNASVAAAGAPVGADIARDAMKREPGASRAALGAGSGVTPPAEAPSASAKSCQVMSASYGGTVTLLIRAESGAGVTLTALDVEGGSEQVQAAAYIAENAPGGKIAGRFKSRDDAVAHAWRLCDSGRP